MIAPLVAAMYKLTNHYVVDSTRICSIKHKLLSPSIVFKIIIFILLVMPWNVVSLMEKGAFYGHVPIHYSTLYIFPN